jgi:hypothetical protein
VLFAALNRPDDGGDLSMLKRFMLSVTLLAVLVAPVMAQSLLDFVPSPGELLKWLGYTVLLIVAFVLGWLFTGWFWS